MDNLNLSILEMTYYYLALFSTLLFIVKTAIFVFTGGDSEVMSDFNTEMEFETSFNLVSLQTILAFFMGFGWIGLACLKNWNLNVWLTGLISIVFGLLLMFGTAYLMFLVKKLNKNVVKDYAKVVGTVGKAYTSFKPQGNGKIEIEVNGSLSIEDALSRENEDIEAFSKVKVVEYKDNVMYIEKYKGEN